MLCKKCGATIADSSKFCGYCGNAVIDVIEIQQPIINNELDLGKTIKIEPKNIAEQNPVNVESKKNIISTDFVNVLESNTTNQNSVTREVDVNNQNIEPNTNNQTITNTQVQEQQVSINSQGVQNNLNKNDKKSNKLFLIIGAVILVLVAIVLVVFAFMKSSNNSIMVLEKSIENLIEKGENSATIDAKVSITATTGEAFSFSATVKTEKKLNDIIDMQVTVNKSLFFEEMNVYASINSEEATMYMESSLIDMLGSTYSEQPLWVYYNIVLDELLGEQTEEVIEENIEEIDLTDIIDTKHFIYIDEINDLSHYEFIIDQELIDTMKIKLSNVNNQDIKDMLDSMGTIEQPIKLDFYITKLNEVSKIELDMSEYLTEEDGISNFVMSIEFRDLNMTKVEIPMNALNSVTSLDAYMLLYTIPEENYDYDMEENYDYYYNYDSNYDTGYGIGVNNPLY